MISEEPDEDADTLDDASVLETYLGSVGQKPESGVQTAANVRDWPPSPERDIGLDLDAETLDWFKANHTHWRLEMVGILRAWMIARTRARHAQQPC
jgi:uncharacterized protein (DUF4415 family)